MYSQELLASRVPLMQRVREEREMERRERAEREARELRKGEAAERDRGELVTLPVGLDQHVDDLGMELLQDLAPKPVSELYAIARFVLHDS